MRTSATKFLMLGVVSMALMAAPVMRPALAAGDDKPSPPPASDSKATKKTKKHD